MTRPASERLRAPTWPPWRDLAVVFCVAFLVRVVQLGSIPPGLDRDAAANGLYALDLIQRGEWPFFVSHMGVAEPLMVYLQAASIALLGSTTVALRVVSAVLGALTACSVTAFAWQLFPDASPPRQRYAAWVAGLGLALCPVHVHVSRLGLRAILTPLLQMVVLTLTLVGIRTGKRGAFAWAGLALGLGTYSYLAFRAVFLLLPVVVLRAARESRSRGKALWQGLAVMALCALAFVLPAVPFFARYPVALFGRAGQVTILQHPLAVERGWWYALLAKAWAQVKMFGLSWQGQYNEMGFTLLDPVLLCLFLVGLAGCIWPWGHQALWRRAAPSATLTRVLAASARGVLRESTPYDMLGRRAESAILLLGMLATLLPDLASDRLAPHVLRVLGVFPFVFVLVGAGAAWVLELGVCIVLGRRAASAPYDGRSRATDVSQRGRRARGAWWVVLLSLAATAGSVVRLYRYGTGWGTPARPDDLFYYHLVEVAEAQVLREAREAVLVPAAEYERSVLRYLTGGRFPTHRAALDAQGVLRPGLLGGELSLLLPRDPDRKRLEGPTFTYDPAQYVLLTGDTVFLLPPLTTEGETRLAEHLAEPPISSIRDANGREVADLYRAVLSPADFVAAGTPAGGRFANGIALTGYTLSDWHLAPGGEVTLALFWQTEHEVPGLRLFVHLLNEQGGVLAFADTLPGQGTYPTSMWRGDERVPTFHRLTTSEDLPPGRYAIEVGWFDPVNLQRLPIVDGSGKAISSRILIAPLKASLAPSTDAPAQRISTHLGQAIALVGYELVGQADAPWSTTPGAALTLSLAWQADERPAGDYKVFVHLASADERILTQHDGIPVSGTYPTTIWEAGEQIVEQIVLAIPADAAPGDYRLWVGMYDPLDGTRLAAQDAAGLRWPDDRILLGELAIASATP